MNRVNIVEIERAPVTVAYLRYTGPVGAPVGRFWRATVAPWLAEHGIIDCPRYGMTLDDPATTPPERCRYDACVELPRGLTLPGAAQTVIPGGRYALTHFRGRAENIGDAWSAFAAAFRADSTRILDVQRHPLEHYPRGTHVDARSGEFRCELLLPLMGREPATIEP